jgi:very-short-patch-repair endonuclease
VSGHFPNPSSDSLSLKGRGTGAKRQGEGLSTRGTTPKILLNHARNMRKDPTDAEAKLWSQLRASRLQGLKVRRQVAFSGNYIADFVCPSAKLVVELDGSQHVDQKAYDERRRKYFEDQGYRVLRFWNNDVLGNMNAVLEAILAAAHTAPLPARYARCPSPLEGEGG